MFRAHVFFKVDQVPFIIRSQAQNRLFLLGRKEILFFPSMGNYCNQEFGFKAWLNLGIIYRPFYFLLLVSDKAPETNRKDLLAEYELMKQLQRHPNVICLMGAVTLSGTFIMYV